MLDGGETEVTQQGTGNGSSDAGTDARHSARGQIMENETLIRDGLRELGRFRVLSKVEKKRNANASERSRSSCNTRSIT